MQDFGRKDTGLIIFTDPDHSGEEIRKKLKDKYPDAKEAFLTRNKALSKGDIGIENASPEAIREALSKAKVSLRKKPDQPEFKAEDLDRGKLTGVEDAAERRAALGDILGIGYANAGASAVSVLQDEKFFGGSEFGNLAVFSGDLEMD